MIIERIKCKKCFHFGFSLFVIFITVTEFVYAFSVDLFERPVSLNGYINQGVQFGIAGDHYDTYAGFQQALMQVLLEAEYEPTNNLRFFGSVQFVKDWVYEIYDSDNDWKEKRFDQSKDELGFYDDYEDILKEFHVTWTPTNLNIRAGKQIVSWGRMDGVRIMDQINPRDTRRGFADVEFETSIIPIWLLKCQYFPNKKPEFFNELGVEVFFDPNADFIANKGFSTGNDVHGIWAADQVVSGARIGYIEQNISVPDRLDPDGFQYGFRINGALSDYSLITINYYRGVDNNYIARAIPPFVRAENALDPKSWDSGKLFEGNLIVHPVMEGFYPDKEYAGFTYSKEFTDLYIESFGGVSPLIRSELIYEIDSTFVSSGKNVAVQEYEKHDAIYWGIGIDWKFKSDLLNPRRMIDMVPQFSHRHIFDYPSGYELVGPGGSEVRSDVYTASLRITTQYYNDKIEPMFYFQRDFNDKNSDLWIFKISYAPDYKWKYSLQLFLVENEGYAAVDNKDNISFTMSYQF